MGQTGKKKKHLFLKLLFLILFFAGIIWYSGSFPVTMELLDKKINGIIDLTGSDFEISFFSDLSAISKKLIGSAEYYFDLAKENISESFSEVEKPGFVLITNAAKFPSEKSRITSAFGKRDDPFSGFADNHSGIDIALPSGSDITAAWPGKIFETGYDNIYGNFVVIKHSEEFFTKYCHLSKICVSENDFVNAEEKIGEAGNTGRSTGSHLHFEVIIEGINIDPMECFEI